MKTGMKNRLIEALAAASTRDITCPRTGATLRMRLVPNRERRIALRKAAEVWGDREVSAHEWAEHEEIRYLHLMAASMAIVVRGDDGETLEPVSVELLNSYDSLALAWIREQFDAFEAENDPRIEEVTEAELEELLDHIKKNGPVLPGSWRIFGSHKLRSSLTILASRLVTSETSMSPG